MAPLDDRQDERGGDRPSSIVAWWRGLGGSVHPADEATFAAFPDHAFDTDYPPPAYIGDVDRAPVLVLMSNGGFGKDTAKEFPDEAARDVYRDRLHFPRPVEPADVSLYYAGSNISGLIRSGEAAIVNAVAYRSPELSAEPINQKVAGLLPSCLAHRAWLAKEVLPDAAAGERLVVLKRGGRYWGIDPEAPPPGVLVSAVSRGPHLGRDVLDLVRRWLDGDRSFWAALGDRPDGVRPEAFLRWACGRDGRYELLNGEILERPRGERQDYGVVRSNILTALSGPAREVGGRCTAGEAVRTGRACVRFPAVVVDLGPVDPDALEASRPVMVVEITSATMTASEVTDRLDEYRGRREIGLILLVDPEVLLAKLYRRRAAVWTTEWFDDLDQVVRLPEFGASLSLAQIYDTLRPVARMRVDIEASRTGSDPGA